MAARGYCLERYRSETSPNGVRLLRERVGLCQWEAAQIAFVDERTWRRWENGERKVSEAAVCLFALLTKQPYPINEENYEELM